MTKTSWILVSMIIGLLLIIGSMTSYGMYIKGRVDGGLLVKERMDRENWINDYLQGGVPVCVANGQVHEVVMTKSGVFKARKSFVIPLGGKEH